MKEKIEEINKLNKQIKELEDFLFIVTEFDEKEKGIPSVKVFMTKSIDVKISLFGSRDFGCGNHSQTLEIPNVLRNTLIMSCNVILSQLKEKLNLMII